MKRFLLFVVFLLAITQTLCHIGRNGAKGFVIIPADDRSSP